MSGLTTSEAPFIEQARRGGELYIEQPYDHYTEENHAAWRSLYSRMLPRWERYANRDFRAGLDALQLSHDRVPRLADVNRFLRPRTGFTARAVSGCVPAFRFFDSLRNREFPTTVNIRRRDHLDYLPEPGIFHDVAWRGTCPCIPTRTSPRRWCDSASARTRRRGLPRAFATGTSACARCRA